MKKPLWTICMLMLALVTAMGCSQKTNTNETASTGQQQAEEAPPSQATGDSNESQSAEPDISEKLTIHWMARAFQGGGWPDDHPMIQEINKKFNVDLKIEWVPAGNYAEKLNVMAASSSFPDAFFVLANEFNKWKKHGLFLDVQPVLQQYPHLAQIPEDALRPLNPKGQLLGFPYYITQSRDSLSVREDWLKKLNLQVPTTMDEFYEVAKAFTKQDPDGNGKPDTHGISFYIDSNTRTIRNIEFIMAAFGLGNKWKEVDGQLIAYQTQVEEWKNFLTFMSKAYSEGIIDRDFAVNKIRDDQDKFYAGKNGFVNVNPNQINNDLKPLYELVPDAIVTPIDPPKGPTGLTGTFHLDMIDKNVINAKIDEKKQQRILMILDYFLSPEGSDFIKHGIEGVHYKKISDDQYEKLEAADKDRQNLINNWIFRPFDPGIQMYKWEDPAHHQVIRDMFARNEKHQWPNPGAGLESETQNKSGANLDAKFLEAVTKIIMGREPVEAIEKASSEWLANGGSKIVEEINQSYSE